MTARALRLALFALLLAGGAHAQERAPQEHEIKAAFLIKFPAFVEWPAASATPAAPFTIGILGASRVAAELSYMAEGRAINERPLVVRTLQPGEALAGVNMVFVGREASVRLAQLAAASDGLLVVSERPGALDEGSMINFLLSEGRVRFEVNVEAAERKGLRISSRLLAVAYAVRAKP